MLRQLQKNDLPQLVTIEKLTQISPWNEETFERCWQSGYVGWVIEKDEQVLGFIMITLQSGECHILNLCVHPDFQRHGHGKMLLQHVLKTMNAKGTRMVFLEVRRSNSPALKLYHQLGFVQIGERQNYYPHGQEREDALVFAKDLSVE